MVYTVYFDNHEPVDMWMDIHTYALATNDSHVKYITSAETGEIIFEK